MFKYSKLNTYFLLIFLILLSTGSSAEILRFDYKGIVEEASSPAPFSDISTGDLIEGYLLIETNADYTVTPTPTNTFYSELSNPPGQSSFIDGFATIEGHSFSSTMFDIRTMQTVSVRDDGTNDGYFAITRTESTDSFGNASINQLFSISASVGNPGRVSFDNTNLEQNFIWDSAITPVEAGSDKNISMFYKDTAVFGNNNSALVINATLTYAELSPASPVPVPAAVWLFVSGLFTLMGAPKIR